MVEMLVVIAIIGILAALIFPAFNAVDARAKRNKALGELKQIEAAIESYHAKYNHYPPDNPPENPQAYTNACYAVNTLFYELLGTVNQTNTFITLDGREQIAAGSVSQAFYVGPPMQNTPKVTGFVNITRPGGDEAVSATAKNFLTGLPSTRYGFAENNGVRYVLLTTSVPWPKSLGVAPGSLGFPEGLNPIRYNSSNPTHNKKTYDLWVDLVIKGKTNRISNWHPSYEIVN